MRDIELELKLKRVVKQTTEEIIPLSNDDWDRHLDTLAEELADRSAEEHIPDNELISIDNIKARLKEDYKEELQMKEMGDAISHGVNIIVEKGRDLLDQHEWSQLVDEFITKLELFINIDFESFKSKTMQEITGISNKTLSSIEKIANKQYLDNDFPSSNALFLLLTLFNPLNFSYWHRLGITYQDLQKYQDAIKTYQNASDLEPNEISTHLYLVECYSALSDKINAHDEFNKAKFLIEDLKEKENWPEYLILLEPTINKL